MLHLQSTVASLRTTDVARYLTLCGALRVAVLLAISATVCSTLAIFPHSLSYFNELAGGPLNGPAHLLDANIDWGQDLLELKRWYKSHSPVSPIHLELSGFVDPKTAGISVATDGARDARGISEPIWYALSLNALYRYDYFRSLPCDYARLQQVSCPTRIGYSIRLYHVRGAPSD
jgi:hypothetical protein